ncbi:MAG: site-2 protease family protein [Candidatus Paceibacterota bacterium]|jgi:regulator of sigma E protease
MFTAILFIIVLVTLIISHEFGHFIAAKLFGVQVDEFGLGFPPKIFGKQYGETFYSLNWLPLGGFVRILGEEGENSEVGPPTTFGGPTSEFSTRSFSTQQTYKKIIILAAGVIGNILLALLLLFVSLQTGLLLPVEGTINPEYLRNRQIIIDYVANDSPASRAGLSSGDTVLGSVDISDLVAKSVGKPIILNIKHAGKSAPELVTVTPQSEDGKTYKIGIAFAIMGEAYLPPMSAIRESGLMTVRLAQETITGLYYFATGIFAKESTVGQVSGPVGIFKMVGMASGIGFSYILAFMALLSINLAVLNILPIPALDGGRILFIIIEKIKGSPIKPEFTQKVHSAGFAILIILMAIVTVHDIVKLF